MYEYHQALVRMRLGESDRQIAKTGLMGRRKLAQVREIAEKQGWLVAEVSLPSDAALALFFSGRASKQRKRSIRRILSWRAGSDKRSGRDGQVLGIDVLWQEGLALGVGG